MRLFRQGSREQGAEEKKYWNFPAKRVSYQVRLITYDYRICAKIGKASFPLPPAPFLLIGDVLATSDIQILNQLDGELRQPKYDIANQPLHLRLHLLHHP